MNNEEYARQWIDYLTKRNARLGIVWPILLSLVILLLVAVMYLFNQLSVVSLKDDSAQQVVQSLEAKFSASQEKIKTLQSDIDSLKGNTDTLVIENQQLSEQVKLMTDEAGLKEQFIAALQDKVVVLETENKNQEIAFNELKSSLTATEQSKVRHISTLEQKYKKSTADLSRQLEARKVAYNALVERQKETQHEMNRLANQLSDNMMEINVIVDDRDRYKRNYDLKSQEHSALKTRYTELEQKFKSMVSPISVNSAPRTKPQSSRVSSEPVVVKDATSNQVASTPAKKQVSQPSSFDYDTIAIDKP